MERRRRWAASGRLPPGLAARFTLAEQSVLSLVAVETARRGDCRLPAPTDDTAHLPLEQREWPFAAVFHQMLLRVEGVEVCRPGEREQTIHIPCSLFVDIYKID